MVSPYLVSCGVTLPGEIIILWAYKCMYIYTLFACHYKNSTPTIRNVFIFTQCTD